jgi:rubrerythrin
MAKTDLEMLQESYTLEQMAVNTYAAAAGLTDGTGKPFIDGAVLSVAQTFIADHTEHARLFKAQIEALGGAVPATTTETTLTDFPPGPNSQLSSLQGILRYALAVEVYAAKLWFQYFKDAQALPVKRLFADLGPNEAAHAALLRATLKFILSVPTDHDNANAGRAVVPFTQLSMDSPVF